MTQLSCLHAFFRGSRTRVAACSPADREIGNQAEGSPRERVYFVDRDHHAIVPLVVPRWLLDPLAVRDRRAKATQSRWVEPRELRPVHEKEAAEAGVLAVGGADLGAEDVERERGVEIDHAQVPLP